MLLIRNLFILCFFLNSTQALGSTLYIKGQLGLSVTTDGTIDGSEVDTHLAAPYPVTLGLGVYVAPMSSLSLELNYETMDITELPPSVTAIGSDTQTQVSAMFNYYFHAPKILILEPFFGAGVGYTQLTIEDNDFQGEGFTWQVTAGADIYYSDVVYLVMEFRFFNFVGVQLSDQNNVDVGEFNTSQVKLMVGLKVKL
jgi:opacity protein-like surface antigen